MRAPCVAVGLGDRLAGDDAVGPLIVDALRPHRRLPPGVELIDGGTDLLRVADRLADREHIVLIDAVLDPDRCGRVAMTTDPRAFGLAQAHAHHLSAVQALELLRVTDERLARTPCTWITIGVRRIAMSPGLSPELARALPGLVDAVLAALAAITSSRPLPPLE